MITISVLGLDQFVVGHYSGVHTGALAEAFGCASEEISFFAPNSMMFHEGTEQTSWNTLLIVRCPALSQEKEDEIADYLLKTFSEFSINVAVEFEFVDPAHRHEKVNEAYPRFIKGSNIKDVDVSYDNEMPSDDEEGPDPRDRADLDPNDPNQIFLGNAFEGVSENPNPTEKNK